MSATDPPVPHTSEMATWKRDAERRRKVLRDFMEARGLKAAPWAKRAKINSAAIYNFLHKHSHSLSPETYRKLADAEAVPVEVLTGEVPTVKVAAPVVIKGMVQGGLWQQAVKWPENDWEVMAIPVQPRYRDKCYGLRVEGPSMNEFYLEGSFVICVGLEQFHRDLLPGDHVICHLVKNDGHVEATVKEYQVDDKGNVWLCPRTTDPRFSQAVTLTASGDIERVEIMAIVVGAYTIRPNT